jgi:predicted pyridoxine 5'-phosphate oxidase superfamily flavin-nucleotide-binding protein
MAEDEDLEVLASPVLALLATADEETGEGSGDEVEEDDTQPIVPGLSERESGFPIPTGLGLPARRAARDRRACRRGAPGPHRRIAPRSPRTVVGVRQACPGAVRVEG